MFNKWNVRKSITNFLNIIMRMDQLNAVDEYTLFWVCNISNEHKNNPDNSFLNFDRAWY